MIKKELGIDLKGFDNDTGTLTAVISSGQPDRSQEMIDQSSWNLDNYLKNPVVLWGHDHSRPAIGKALNVYTNVDGMLEAVVQFAVKESAFAKEIYDLYAGRFLNAFSVGFINGRTEEKDGVKLLKDNELYEFSAVNIGMDALALAKQKGFNVKEIENNSQEPEKPEKVVNIKVDEKMSLVTNGDDKTTISVENIKRVEQARDSLNRALKTKQPLNYKKILNKAIRELIQAKK